MPERNDDHLPPPGEYDDLSEQELDEYLDDYIEEDVKLKKKSSAKGALNFVLVLGAFGVFGALAYYAYEYGMIPRDPSQLPIVSAESESFRVAPEDPGGMEIPNQDKKVFDTIDGDKELPTVERILPAPEEPIDIATLDEDPLENWEDSGGTLRDDELAINAPEAPVAPEEPKAPETPEEPALDDDILFEDITEEAEVVEPKEEASEVSPAPEKNIPAPQKEEKPAPKKSTAPIKPVDNTLDFLREKEKQVTKKAPARPEVIHRPAPSKPVNTKVETGYSVQLGAFKSEADARVGWDKIIKRFTEQLGGLKVFVERADLGEKGVFYRLKAGKLDSETQARELCEVLTKEKQGCFVTK